MLTPIDIVLILAVNLLSLAIAGGAAYHFLRRFLSGGPRKPAAQEALDVPVIPPTFGGDPPS